MGRPRKFKSVVQLKNAWEEYKHYCDNQTVLTHSFSSAHCEYVSKELKHSTTYTIEGFCDFIDITRQSFHDYYANDPRFADTVTRMKEACEVDARKKFELGKLPTQLAGLWMSNYGYSTKTDGNVQVKNNVQIVDDMDG